MMEVELRIHKSMMVEVENYSAIAVQSAIAAMMQEGAPANAAIDAQRVGSHEYPRVLVRLEWSDMVTKEVSSVPTESS